MSAADAYREVASRLRLARFIRAGHRLDELPADVQRNIRELRREAASIRRRIRRQHRASGRRP